MNFGSSQGTRTALENIFNLIVISNSDNRVSKILQSTDSQISGECEWLTQLITNIQVLSNDPIQNTPSPSKSFRKHFKEAALCLPDQSFLTKGTPACKTLTIISKLISKFSLQNHLRKEIASVICKIADGTTSYHMQKLRLHSTTKSKELVDQLKTFQEKHLLDAIQTPVDAILLFDVSITSSDHWDSSITQNTLFTSAHDLFFSKLQVHVMPRIWASLSSVERTPDAYDSLPVSAGRHIGRSDGQMQIATERSLINPKKSKKRRRSRANRSKEDLRLDILPCEVAEKDLSPLMTQQLIQQHRSEIERLERIHGLPRASSSNLAESPRLRIGLRVRNQAQKDKTRSSRLAQSPSRNFFEQGQNNSTSGSSWNSSSQTEVRAENQPAKRLVSCTSMKTTDMLLSLGTVNSNMNMSLTHPASDRQPRVVRPLKSHPVTPRKRLIAKCNGYWIEEGTSHDPLIALHPEDLVVQNDFPDGSKIPFGYWFERFFEEGTYSAHISTNGPDGPAVLLVKKEKHEKTSSYRVLYLTKERTVGSFVRSPHLHRKLVKGNVLKKLVSTIDPLISAKTLRKCEFNIHKALAELQRLEQVHFLAQTTFKFGILNWVQGNKNEEDMFSNQNISPAFQRFLSILGDEITLFGWDKYAGGLDTSMISEGGDRSLFTTFSGCSIMFHVAPFLPFSASNQQQLARKKHIGNDVVVLVFNESSKPYLASLIASQFNHVVIVVSHEEEENGSNIYSVSITAKEDVPTFDPPLPINGRFYSEKSLREFLLQKMINGEKASVQAPAFIKRLSRSRELLLRCLVDNHFNHCYVNK